MSLFMCDAMCGSSRGSNIGQTHHSTTCNWYHRRLCALSVLLWFPLCVLVPAVKSSPLAVRGAGASFPRKVYDSWNIMYQQKRSRHVNLDMRYESIGSGGGKARIIGEKEPHVHYAGSDSVLTEAERAAHPNLRMVPTLVGAIVMAYNIPGIDQLTLNLHAVTGIYNGSIVKWNDPIILDLNPGLTLPDVPIIAISRSDKSGTTESFTRGLSVYSPEWNNTYGTFSVGLDDEARPIKWNQTVIKFFGFTNRGINGMILSLRYSIGYMSIADARDYDMQYAYMKNRDGFVIDVNLTTVQSAVQHANMTFELMNLPGRLTYPLVSYTYFIINVRSTYGCDSMVELVRFIDWFYTSERATQEAQSFYFTPLDSDSISVIEDSILKNMTCDRKNLWALVRAKMIAESIEPENTIWQVPAYITLAVLVLVIIALAAVFTRQQLIIHNELLNDAWLISPESIGGDTSDAVSAMGSHPTNIETEVDKVDESVFTPEGQSKKYSFGVFDDQTITIVKMNRFVMKFTIKQRKCLLSLRDTTNHVNVMKFVGLMTDQSQFYICHLGKIRISLSAFLRNAKVKINEGGRISVVKDIISGMRYLHKKGIVHGNLSSANIMIDMAWNVRIASWMETHIATQQNSSGWGNKIQPTDFYAPLTDNNIDKDLFWMAPEIIKYKRYPVYSSDMYSFGMVLQEVFSGKELFDEVELPPKEVVGAILSCCLRPQFSANTPVVIRSLMESCWGIDPAQRPSFQAVDTLIKNHYPKQMHLLDTIIDSMQQYAITLRKDLAESTREATVTKLKLQAQVEHFLPAPIRQAVLSGQHVDVATASTATVMAFQITNLPQLLPRVTSQGIVNTLNKFYNTIDEALAREEVFKINRLVSHDLYVSGLPTPSPRHAAAMCLCALRVLFSSEDFSNDHLAGLDQSLTVAVAIDSGPLVGGVLGKAVQQYVVIGQPLTEVVALLGNTKSGTIQLSERTFSMVKGERSLVTNQYETLKGMVYTLEGQSRGN